MKKIKNSLIFRFCLTFLLVLDFADLQVFSTPHPNTFLNASKIASESSDFFANMPFNEWVKIPVDTTPITVGDSTFLSPPKLQAHSNFTIDYKNRKIVSWGNDTHISDWTHKTFNFSRVFDLETLRWEVSHFPDGLGSYTSKILGQRDGKTYWIPITTTNRPVSSHTFDSPRYIPGSDLVLLTFDPQHVSFDSLHKSAPYGKVSGIREPSCWLYNTVTKAFTNINHIDYPAPDLFSGATCYDSKRNRILGIVSGGWGVFKKGEIWAFDVTTYRWSKLDNPTNNDLGYDFSSVYDAYQDKILVYGTRSKPTGLFEYDIVADTWTFMGQGMQPPASEGLTAYDTLNNCLVLVTKDQSTWAYDSKTRKWKDLDIVAPLNDLSKEYHMTFDPVTNTHIFAQSLLNTKDLYALKYRP